MKPEELDELFRSGLAEQQLPPRPQAWDSIQQRLRAPIGEEDELPAFLRKAPEPAPAAAPALMTASRGGGGGVMTISWHQRPMWRAAAVAVLAVGGLLAQQQLRQADPTAPTVAVTPATERSVTTTPVMTLAPATPSVAATAATVAPTATETAAASIPTAGPAASPAPAPTAAPRLKEPVGYALAATDVTPAFIHEHLLCADQQCRDCDLIEQKIGAAHFRSLRAEAAAELLARSGMKVVVEQPGTSGYALASATARTSHRTMRHAPTAPPQPEMLPAAPEANPLADAIVEVKIVPEVPEPEMPMAAEEAPVQVASTRRSLRPSDVLRRAKERLIERIDRADNRSDGRLTIDTQVAGRPVRKTISL